MKSWNCEDSSLLRASLAVGLAVGEQRLGDRGREGVDVERTEAHGGSSRLESGGGRLSAGECAVVGVVECVEPAVCNSMMSGSRVALSPAVLSFLPPAFGA